MKLASFSKVGIVGMGVMGGSLLLALKKKGFPGQVHVTSRSADTRAWASDSGADFVYEELLNFPKDLDVIFLALPISALEKAALTIFEMKLENTLVSDMSSSKSRVLPRLIEVLKGNRLLSVHPMCGSEKTGREGANEDLYLNKKILITPHDASCRDYIAPMENFWSFLGADSFMIAPDHHDQAVAWVSHMPHLVISALVKSVANKEEFSPGIFDIAGTGFRDISRLAAINPSLWKDILVENLPAVVEALGGMRAELERVEDLLKQADRDNGRVLEAYLGESREIHQRRGLEKK